MARTKEWRKDWKGWADMVAQIMVIGWKTKGNIFYKLRGVLKMSCLKKLYFALVHPHIPYGIEVYAKADEYVTDKLYKLNTKILSILLNKTIRTSIIELYSPFNTLPMPLLRS